MLVDDFVTLLEKKAKQNSLTLFQIALSDENNFEIQLQDQCVLKNNMENSSYLEFSVIQNGKRAVVSTDNFEPEMVDLLIFEALENLKTQEIDEEFFLFGGNANYHDVKPFVSDMQRFNRLNLADYLKKSENLAYEKYPQIEKVMSAFAYQIQRKSLLKNSLGLNLSSQKNIAAAGLSLRVKDGDLFKIAGDMVFFDKTEDFSPETLVDKAAKRVLAKIGGLPAPHGKTNVVFENRVFADFLLLIAPIFGAYEAEKKYCKFTDCLGQKVAADCVTITDNPWLDYGMSTAAYDAEGVPTNPKNLIENGVLTHMLYNLSMAHQHQRQSTGNAAGGLKTKVFNLTLQAGQSSLDDLYQKAGEGVFVTSLQGAHVGLSLASGDFSFAAEGNLIENGKLSHPLNPFTLSGNIYDLLFAISDIANDSLFCYKNAISPSVLVENVCAIG